MSRMDTLYPLLFYYGSVYMEYLNTFPYYTYSFKCIISRCYECYNLLTIFDTIQNLEITVEREITNFDLFATVKTQLKSYIYILIPFSTISKNCEVTSFISTMIRILSAAYLVPFPLTTIR